MQRTMHEVLHPRAEWSRDPTFPHAPEQWSPAEGHHTARRLGRRMTEDHWELVRALQAYFASHSEIQIRKLYDALEERFHHSGGMRYLYTLFPGGPLAEGCQIAGLPPPPGSVNRSFGSVQ